MPHNLYRIICTSVLGLPLDSWTNLDCHPHGSGVQKSAPTRSRSNNLLLWHQYILYKNAPVSLPRDPKDMATIFVRLTLLVVGADACTPHIHQKQHHVPYSLAISINGTFLLIHGIASTLWAFQYVFLIIYFRYFLFLVIFSCPSETVPYLRNFYFRKFGFPSIFIFLYFCLI